MILLHRLYYLNDYKFTIVTIFLIVEMYVMNTASAVFLYFSGMLTSIITLVSLSTLLPIFKITMMIIIGYNFI